MFVTTFCLNLLKFNGDEERGLACVRQLSLSKVVIPYQVLLCQTRRFQSIQKDDWLELQVDKDVILLIIL